MILHVISIEILVCLLSNEEVSSIKSQYDYNERLKDNSMSDDSVFTEYNLNTFDNSGLDASKSVILAPYNTKEEFNEEIKSSIVDKKVIKFESKLREIDRKFERNNNSNIDNGIYTKLTTKEHCSANCLREFMMPYHTNINPDNQILKEMIKLGFDKDHIMHSLKKNLHNSATTCYYLLSEL